MIRSIGAKGVNRSEHVSAEGQKMLCNMYCAFLFRQYYSKEKKIEEPAYGNCGKISSFHGLIIERKFIDN
jgi:hypothetical protein